ncbi:P26 [Dione juno nucleopolyhedrovirus]|uniref:P26 n=1 Tax=Dione juno nucleopolyhedrovirus TaxID=2594175 RepID=A0AAE6H2R1_9ABAC|nr:P26 [Dione juno nucleopolyhedrovirus]QDL56944.1 P26 [Dione juno nucleopolyhedrovirus]
MHHFKLALVKSDAHLRLVVEQSARFGHVVARRRLRTRVNFQLVVRQLHSAVHRAPDAQALCAHAVANVRVARHLVGRARARHRHQPVVVVVGALVNARHHGHEPFVAQNGRAQAQMWDHVGGHFERRHDAKHETFVAHMIIETSGGQRPRIRAHRGEHVHRRAHGHLRKHKVRGDAGKLVVLVQCFVKHLLTGLKHAYKHVAIADLQATRFLVERHLHAHIHFFAHCVCTSG